jgi:hypothetical protein
MDQPEVAQSVTRHSENLTSKPPLRTGPLAKPTPPLRRLDNEPYDYENHSCKLV